MISRLKPINSNDRRLCIAINNIGSKCTASTTDEAVFIEWIRDGLEVARKRNDSLQDNDLRWNQGACQALDEILGSFEIARQVLKNN